MLSVLVKPASFDVEIDYNKYYDNKGNSALWKITLKPIEDSTEKVN